MSPYSPSVVGLLWQPCHTLFFQKAFLANAKGCSLSVGHVLREEPNSLLVCPKPARAPEVSRPAHPSLFHPRLTFADCLNLGLCTAISPGAGRKEEVRKGLNSSQIWVSPLLQGSGDERKVLGKERHVVPGWKVLPGCTGVSGPH